MRLRKELIEADNILDEVSRALPFSTITPSNEQKVRREFMKGKHKDPHLEYETPSVDMLALRRKASSFTLPERDAVESLMVEKQHDLIRKIDLINSIGCFDFTERSEKLYGKPNKSLVDKAYAVLESPVVDTKTEKMLATDAVKLLRDNFKHHGLRYKVKRDTLVGSCDINCAHSVITLKKKERFSRRFMNRLVIHEIGTHAFRYENGAAQKLKIFCHGLSGYLETEEGLALYMEEEFGVNAPLHNSAGHVIAGNMARNHGFLQTYHELLKYFDKKKAFTIALRAKRGLADTSVAGGYTKDHLYFKGYSEVKKFIEKGGSLEELYVGKVGIKDIPILRTLRLKKPKYLPKDFILVPEHVV